MKKILIKSLIAIILTITLLPISKYIAGQLEPFSDVENKYSKYQYTVRFNPSIFKTESDEITEEDEKKK